MQQQTYYVNLKLQKKKMLNLQKIKIQKGIFSLLTVDLGVAN